MQTTAETNSAKDQNNNNDLTSSRDFIQLIQESIVKHWNEEALTDYKGDTLRYKDVARKIEKIHIFFEQTGIRKGDKVALCGRNCAHWAVAYIATLTYGAVCVPILHEFKPDQVEDLVNHSEARLLFVGDYIWPQLDAAAMPDLEGIIGILDFQVLLSRSEELTYAREHLNELYGKKFPKFFRAEHVHYRTSEPEELALINYTSGTTSNSKGVMVPYRAMWSNYHFALEVLEPYMPKEGARLVSILPMAHMYGMAFEFLYGFLRGTHLYFLTRVPSPKIIFQAFGEIKPHLIICVPLVLEKVIKNMILPKLQTPSMKILLGLPVISQHIRNRIREQLFQAFGGNFYEIIVGGAAFNSEVELFLHRIGFNVTVGYGTTETAPIISYSDWKEARTTSCGVAAPRMEIKIDSSDPYNIVGEILTRGDNVMLGYYKNEAATQAAFIEDGWYRTGDLGVLDEDGYLYIKGRSKNMLLGANGQNIYPEEIEDKLSTMPYVSECIVIQKGEHLYALIHPNYEEAQRDNVEGEALLRQLEQNRKDLNEQIPAYERIQGIKIFEEEFEKTAKRTIKRYLYVNEEV